MSVPPGVTARLRAPAGYSHVQRTAPAEDAEGAPFETRAPADAAGQQEGAVAGAGPGRAADHLPCSGGEALQAGWQLIDGLAGLQGFDDTIPVGCGDRQCFELS